MDDQEHAPERDAEAAPPRGDDVDERDVERLDPDAPGRSMFTPGEDAVEPNEPA